MTDIRGNNKLLGHAISVLSTATVHDDQKQYVEALKLYTNALDVFIHLVKYETIEQKRSVLEMRVKEIMTRAEAIKRYLEEKQRLDEETAAGDAEKRDGGEEGEEKEDGDTRTSKELKRFRKELESTILDMSAEHNGEYRVRWDDIAGLEQAKEVLYEAIVLPVQLPSLFTGGRKPWKSILLHGPPGTGKSEMARAAATELNATFMNISSTDLFSKWQGESEKYVRALFELARERQPAIVFIDEIDSMCCARGDGDNESSRRVKDEFLIQMNSLDQSQVLVMGATNIPWSLDDGMLRRFGKRIHIGLPTAQARARIFHIRMRDVAHDITTDQFIELAACTAGYSGSDLKLCAQEASMSPVRKVRHATHFLLVAQDRYTPCSPGAPAALEMDWMAVGDKRLVAPVVTMRDMLRAVGHTHPTVNSDTLPRYTQWDSRFGTTE